MGTKRIDGIDLSDFQQNLKIDWHGARAAGVRFAYLKATEGTDWQAQSFNTRYDEARAANVRPGAYHFAHPAPGNAKAEAEWFCQHARVEGSDMRPVLDLEVNDHRMSPDALTTWVEDWFAHVFRHFKISKGVLYTHFTLVRRPKGVVLWASRYSDPNWSPVVPRPFRTWAIWQFTDGQFGNPKAVPGVGHVDASTLHRRFGFARLNALTLPPDPKTAPAPKPVKVKKETPVQRILRIAKAQVGYHEGRSNGHWDNVQKFSAQTPGLAWSQGQPWCCTFVSWCAHKARLDSYYPSTASCRTAMRWWKDKNQWSEYPAVGAQVIYGNGEHTGLVLHFDATYIWAIEGNTNTNGSAEGDGVYIKKRLRRDPYVTGYGYPEIPGVRLRTADPNYYASRSAS